MPILYTDGHSMQKERAGWSDPMNKVWLIVTRMMRCVDKHKAGFSHFRAHRLNLPHQQRDTQA